MAYKKKRAIDVNDANLNIVPYYVMKKPSLPSLIGSATSCIALVPVGLSKIQPNNHVLKKIKPKALIKVQNAIRFEVELETNAAKMATLIGAKATIKILNTLDYY